MAESVLTGSVTQLPLLDILRMLIAGRQTGRLELAEGIDVGGIYLRDGAVVHAVAGPRTGEPAIFTMLDWVKANFRFEPRVAAREDSVTRPTELLLQECTRETSEREAIRQVIPSVDVVMAIAPAAPAGPVTLQPQEWQALAQVNGERSVADIAAILRQDEFATVRLLYRLASEGLLETVRQNRPAPSRATVRTDFFDRLVREVTEALGPIGPIIVDDEIAALGGSRDAFPRDQVAHLVERISGEIRDPHRRLRFQEHMLDAMRGL
ncbi:MAG TPA: DUF4388 domain-containing protein [Dehalococcoidia bacterium]|nr:DUF4388 domain-containing protein [Dehalococcoidia bacterium]